MGRKDPQEELNLDLKLKEFFLSTHPQSGAWLTNQFISPGFRPLWKLIDNPAAELERLAQY